MLMNVQKQEKNTFVMVSHDMGVHYQITDRMVIMYAGKVVEIAPTEVMFERPQHPYTEMLIRSLPRLGDDSERSGISGRPPSLLNPLRRLSLCRPLQFGRCPLQRSRAGTA
ncbi:MAG: hypothetical protein R2851_03165 [Caldilineaceae bacterium]